MQRAQLTLKRARRNQSLRDEGQFVFWYGYYLYIADTLGGFRVFDSRHIWKVSTGDKSKIGRQSDGSYHAHDYAYALPQALTFVA